MFTMRHLAVLLFLFSAVANANGIVESHRPENCIATRNQGRNQVQSTQTEKPATEKPKRSNSNQE